MSTIAAASQRIPRPALIAVVALLAAFAALMVVRAGVLGGSDDSTSATPAPAATVTKAKAKAKDFTTPAKPEIVLLPGLPSSVANALRSSKVTVVSLYVGRAEGDRVWVAEARKGARTAGAGFVAVNVGSDKAAASVASFVGSASSPSMLVVRRPGTIVTRIAGPVDSAVVAQAAHNAGARR